METPLAILTLSHVAASLVGIGSGLMMVGRMATRRPTGTWPVLFLWSTGATTASGFFFPFHVFTPAFAVGVVSSFVLLIAVIGWCRRAAARWRRAFVISSLVALYLNIFVLVVQLFLKVPVLHDLAPRQSDPPFIVSQLIVLAAFVALGAVATHRDGRVAAR